MAAFVRFPSTFWTTIAQRPERARAQIFSQYRMPIFNYIQNHGFSEHDTDDLTQEVFMRVCHLDFLKQVDRAKGKFRSLLLAVTRHVILRERDRHGRRKALSIEQGGLDQERMEIANAPERDKHFDALWVQNVTRLALQTLMEACSSGGPRFYDALVMRKLQGLSYDAIAVTLGVSVRDVTNWVHQGKLKFKQYAIEAIRAYSSSEAEFRDELAAISRLLK